MKRYRFLLICGLFLVVLLNTGYTASAQTNQEIKITEIGSFDTYIPSFGPEGWAANVQVQNDIAYVSDTVTGLRIIDVSDPSNPTPVGHYYEDIDELHEMYVDGNLVYLADYRDGFKILNVSNPADPTLVSTFDDGGEVGRFEIVGDLAYVVDFVDGLEILNISDPSHMIELVQYNTGIDYMFNIEIQNDLAYVSDFVSVTESKIIILNISDIHSIDELAAYTIAGEPFMVDFVDNLAYSVCSYGGLKIFDNSNPLSMTELGNYYDGGNAVDIDFYEGYAVIADRDDGLEFLEITTPTNPTEIASYFDGGSASGIDIVGDLIFVADGEDGLEILQIEMSPIDGTAADLTGIILIAGALVILLVIVIVTKMKKS